MCITHLSLLQLLQQMPDAKGTVEFLNVMRCVIDSYLVETITALTRIHKAWFAIIFLVVAQATHVQPDDDEEPFPPK